MNSFQFLFDLPAYQAAKNPNLVVGGHWKQGQITSTSIEEFQKIQNRIAIQIYQAGVKKDDRVILITNRFSLEWLATDMAIMSIASVSCPVHYPQRNEDIQSIIDRLEPSLIIHSSDVEISRFQNTRGIIAFEQLTDKSATIDISELQALEKIQKAIIPNNIATIVHTSGSSGEPRAVCLSHRNLMSNLMSILSLVPFTVETKVMSFLPLSHIFERMVCYVYLASGASIYFLDSYRYAVYALKDIKPDYFTSVPLILERFAAALEDRIEEMGWFTRWAYSSWENSKKGPLAHIGSMIAQQWIIKRWRHKMGGKLKGIISGAAYLDPKVEKLYERSGIKIRQGYGLTEASPVVAINRFEPGGHRSGTVGLPLPGVQVKIAADGEVLVKGPNVMVGYYNDEAATNQVIIDGWLHTGDIGRWEKEDFLVITDRKSNIYKHASGKFISPAQIESTLDQYFLIHQSMIIGYHRPFNVALIVPDFEKLKEECERKKFTGPHRNTWCIIHWLFNSSGMHWITWIYKAMSGSKIYFAPGSLDR